MRKSRSRLIGSGNRTTVIAKTPINIASPVVTYLFGV